MIGSSNLSSDSVVRTLQLVEAIAELLGITSEEQEDIPMATVTFSIGTSGRDYSTITAWEADLDNAILYNSGDDAVGECYNDSAFGNGSADEAIQINGGSTVGLSSVTLTVPSSERHDGTAGTGARILLSATATSHVLDVNRQNCDVEWLEIDVDENIRSSRNYKYVAVSSGNSSSPNNFIRNMIVHHAGTSSSPDKVGSIMGNVSANRNQVFMNCMVYNCHFEEGTGASSSCIEARDNLDKIQNCTVHNATRYVGASNQENYGILQANSDAEITNNIATDIIDDNGSLGENLCFKLTGSGADYNLSSDDSSDDFGSNSIISVSASSQFVSVIAGSEDLHLKSGSDAIDTGSDLGTTDGVNIDINGRDRDAEGDTWDMGCHEFVGSGGGGESIVAQLSKIMSRRNTLLRM